MRKRKKFEEGELGGHIIALAFMAYIYVFILIAIYRAFPD